MKDCVNWSRRPPTTKRMFIFSKRLSKFILRRIFWYYLKWMLPNCFKLIMLTVDLCSCKYVTRCNCWSKKDIQKPDSRHNYNIYGCTLCHCPCTCESFRNLVIWLISNMYIQGSCCSASCNVFSRFFQRILLIQIFYFNIVSNEVGSFTTTLK